MVNTEPDDADRFAANFRLVRESRGISQQKVVDAMRAAGFQRFHPTTLSRIELGQRLATFNEARALAKFLGMPVERLVDDPEQSEHIQWVLRAVHTANTEGASLVRAATDFRRAQNLVQRLLPIMVESGSGRLLEGTREIGEKVAAMDGVDLVKRAMARVDDEYPAGEPLATSDRLDALAGAPGSRVTALVVEY